MAVDTDTRKFSAMHVGLSWRGINAIPSGLLDAPEWFSLLGLYNEFAASESSGPTFVTVPDVDDPGFTEADAVADIEAADLGALVVLRFSGAVALGTVISQVPLPGVEVLTGSTVTIYVSRGAYRSRSDYGFTPDTYGPVSYTKTPDEEIDIEFPWATKLNGETVASDTFELPDGLTSESEIGAQSLRTIRISGGVDGFTYRVIGKVVTSAGRELEWVQRVLVREG